MAPATQDVTLTMDDGGEMAGHLAVPESGSGAGIVVLMEIFGVVDYTRDAAARLAGLGYVALVPDLYRRTQPGAAFGRTDEELQDALQASAGLDRDGAVQDAAAAMAWLAQRPEVAPRAVGILGFCMGGELAFRTAAAAQPATAVAYYGAGIGELLDRAAQIDCPLLLHYGAQDAYIDAAEQERVGEAARGRAGWEFHVQPDGGHAFDNWTDPRFSCPEAAARAWEQTAAFLTRTLQDA